MATLKGSGPALITTAEDEFREIIRWYEDQLANTAPPTDLVWDPIRIGPTWQWSESGGWLLPEVTLGWRVLAWCGRWLRDKHGNPWQFTPEQTRFILWYFSLDADGSFTFHSAVLQRLKGWGKDPIAAVLSCAACFAEVTFDHWDGDRPVGRDEPNAWVQIVAVSKTQTQNTMKLFPSLIPAETRLRYGIQIGKMNVWGLGDSRQIEAVTRSPLAIEGGRPTQTIRAETQNWNSSNKGHDMAEAMEGNAAKSEGGAARMLDICNAHRADEDSVGERVRDSWELTQADDDSEEAVAAEFGLMYDSLEAPPDAPLTEEDAPEVLRAVRGDSYWLDTKPNGRIVKSILNTNNPASESRRKWYNSTVAAADAWMVPEHWDQNRCPRVVEPGERIVMFFDGSKSDDATAIMGCAMEDGYVFRVGIWQRPPKADGWIVDRDAVDHRVREAFDLWDPIGFWGDPSDARDDESGERFWEPYLDSWAETYGHRLKRLPAVKSGPTAHLITWDMRDPKHQALFVPAAERFTTDAMNRCLPHDGDELMKQHVRNAKRRPNKHGVGLGKKHRESRKKVDGAVCGVGARMMWRIALGRGIKAHGSTRKAMVTL